MFSSETHVRVRYAETDQMGVVYHGNYAAYFEIGRTDALRDMGLTYKSFEEEGIMMPVLDLQCKFLRPAKYDDLLRIRTIIKKAPSVRLHFDYEIYRDDELITLGSVTLVCLNIQTNRPCPAPLRLVDALKNYFE